MSNEFHALRVRAKQKRDRGIAALQAEYESALTRIASLEQDLLGLRPSGYKKISAAIESVLPREAPFTTVDVMASLEALDPRRVWRKRSVDSHLFRLRERGLIRRIKRANVHEPAVYARAEATVQAGPLGDMTLLQVIGKVLTLPMTATEIVVAAMEAGYQTKMKREHLRQHVKRELKLAGFKQDGGKWMP